MATDAVPTWGSPVGDGAMRVRTDISGDGLLARSGAADENVNYTTRWRPDWQYGPGEKRRRGRRGALRQPRESLRPGHGRRPIELEREHGACRQLDVVAAGRDG